MRTKLSTCTKKRRFDTDRDAQAFALGAGLSLASYRCDRCRKFHLTRRIKGKRLPKPNMEAKAPPPLAVGTGRGVVAGPKPRSHRSACCEPIARSCCAAR
jgi:hypothetical protein